jgi:hypothetical protein
LVGAISDEIAELEARLAEADAAPPASLIRRGRASRAEAVEMEVVSWLRPEQAQTTPAVKATEHGGSR